MSHAIMLTRGKVAIVDAEDVPDLARFSWCAAATGYAVGRVAGRNVLMHRYLLSAPAGVEVDHINGDRLDNRRNNLRLATRTQNGQNNGGHSDRATRYKGVGQDRATGLWFARLKTGGRSLTFGWTTDPTVAAIAYDAAARFHFGAFARTNFPGTDAVSVHNLIRQTRQSRPDRATRYRGVTPHGQTGKFRARFRDATLGYYDTAVLAAQAYDAAAREEYGARAKTNFT